MLTVYLCEDHPEELDFFKETILKILEDFSGKILWGGAFSSPDQLLDTRAGAEGCGIYFLDIDLGQSSMNGLTLAQKPGVGMTLFAFDAGEAISTHAAPGDAMATILEGTAEITVDGTPHTLNGGEAIVMPAGIPHAVKAVTRFKMYLVVVKA